MLLDPLGSIQTDKYNVLNGIILIKTRGAVFSEVKGNFCSVL